MADLDQTFYGAGTVIHVQGLSRLNRLLAKAGADAQDMKDLMHAIGMAVIQVASPPVRTGRLKDTLRAGRGKTKAVVRVGGARAPYAGVQEYGWSARGITGTGWLNAARDSRRDASRQMIRDGIDDLLKKNDLL